MNEKKKQKHEWSEWYRDCEYLTDLQPLPFQHHIYKNQNQHSFLFFIFYVLSHMASYEKCMRN